MEKIKAVGRSLAGLLYRAGVKVSITGVATSLPLLLVSTSAHALKVSAIIDGGWSTEISSTVQIFLLAVAGIGACFSGAAVITGMIAKKNKEPLSWQVYGLFGGALAFVVPVFILALAGSLSNEQGDAEGTMSELNINY